MNEAQRRAENVATVKLLERRVEDWKGHALSNFGELLLDDVFMVTKSEVDREYHVFLFEKIILCCKDATAPNPNRKVGKSNSILKKQSTSGPPQPVGLLASGAAAKKKTTPLLLKGRIFLNNVTQATPSNRNGESLKYSCKPPYSILLSRRVGSSSVVAWRRRPRVLYSSVQFGESSQAMGDCHYTYGCRCPIKARGTP